MLSAKVDSPEASRRLTSVAPGKFGLCIDVEMPCDQVVEYEDSKVLWVEDELAINLEGFTIDVEDTPQRSALAIIKEEQS
ncbi:hypothetical protein ACFLUS_00095 [Chloroflexota bacterium]